MVNYQALEKAKQKLDEELKTIANKDHGFKDDKDATAMMERLVAQTRSYVEHVQTIRK